MTRANQEAFRATCFADSSDHLEVRAYKDLIAVEVEREILGSSMAFIELDEDNARALFNWIGVWLHTR